MKICAVVCEYNPMHNGHKYLIEAAKAKTGADGILCIMSGNFTQRGEMAVLNKYARARHAVLSGADAVIELPTVFSTASAEFFSRGAIKMASSIPSVKYLAFGCENDDISTIIKSAKILSEEPKDFKAKIKEKLKSGLSFVRARTEALSETGGLDEELLTRPNNILAFEYAKAVYYWKADISLVPIKRVGAEHSEENLKEGLSSAGAIRKNMFSKDRKTVKLIKSGVPPYVFVDLKTVKENNFKQLAVYSVMSKSAEELKEILDCGEGLENRFKALTKDTWDYDELIEKMTTKRYTSSRLKRIILSSFLGIKKELIEESMEGDLYIKALAVKKERAEEILGELSAARFPLVTRKSDATLLKKTAAECFKKDAGANDLYSFLSGKKTNEYLTLFV